MALQQRNEYLDLPPSDEEVSDLDRGYDSEAAEERRPTHRAPKRRRISQPVDSDLSDEHSDVSSDEGPAQQARTSVKRQKRNNLPTTTSSSAQHTPPTTSAPLRTLAPSSTTAAYSASAPSTILKPAPKPKTKPGIIYLSRIPPFLRPSALRSLLLPHAPKHGLNRLFLTPEPATSHTLRRKTGGNKKRTFIDGWVEFNSKKEAKLAVELLNAQSIGGKKGGYYHDDVWNLRYLRGFKWIDLVGRVAGENQERKARMDRSMAVQRKVDRGFVDAVERGREVEGMRRKREAQAKARGGDDGIAGEVNGLAGDGGARSKDGTKDKRFATHFRQNRVMLKDADPAREQPKDVQRVLSKIF